MALIQSRQARGGQRALAAEAAAVVNLNHASSPASAIAANDGPADRSNTSLGTRLWQRCDRCFREQSIYLWPHLSRAINLLVMVNISLFFLTGAVTKQGYYFPLVSLGLLALGVLLILLPLGLQDRLAFYFSVLGICLAAGWFLGASIMYWLQHNGA
jgi:hypothetical protein